MIVRKLFFLIILVVSAKIAFAQSSKDILMKTIRDCDIVKLSHLLEDEVYLTIQNNKGTFKKEKAASIIHAFIEPITPKDFIFKHEGYSKNSTMYLIGQLQTTESSYRTYLLYTEEAGIIKISELRIESEE